MWPDIWRRLTRCQNEVRPGDTLTTHDVRTKPGPTTPWLHTMSERSQSAFMLEFAKQHPDYTRWQNEVRPDDTLTTNDVRTKSEGSQTMSGHVGPHRIVSVFTHQCGQAFLSTDQSRRLHFLPFFSLNASPSVSQMHAKGCPSFFSSPLFFPFKPGRMFGTGCLEPRILEPTN